MLIHTLFLSHCILPRDACSYENIVQIRCLYEGVAVDDMLATWHSNMLPSYMKKWELDRDEVRLHQDCCAGQRCIGLRCAGRC